MRHVTSLETLLMAHGYVSSLAYQLVWSDGQKVSVPAAYVAEWTHMGMKGVVSVRSAARVTRLCVGLGGFQGYSCPWLVKCSSQLPCRPKICPSDCVGRDPTEMDKATGCVCANASVPRGRGHRDLEKVDTRTQGILILDDANPSHYNMVYAVVCCAPRFPGRCHACMTIYMKNNRTL